MRRETKEGGGVSKALPLKPPYTGEGKGGEKRGGNFPLPLSPLNPASKAVRLCYQRQAREKRSLMSHRRRCHPSSSLSLSSFLSAYVSSRKMAWGQLVGE